ncbi:hypothetical protein M8818_006500 [Zalaria obscura]|uniref:Uncharacterized protein n=1 Tax=Zalaria obscura TaxID=2024903 RepID=A0ACC3S6K6_9PEZI
MDKVLGSKRSKEEGVSAKDRWSLAGQPQVEAGPREDEHDPHAERHRNEETQGDPICRWRCSNNNIFRDRPAESTNATIARAGALSGLRTRLANSRSSAPLAWQQQQQQQQQAQQTTSPINSRKRRASELESAVSASSGQSAFSLDQAGLFGAESGSTVGLGLGGAGPSNIGVAPSPTQASNLPSPVVKKGRTNTPWTPAEEQRLKQMRDAGNSWSEIAKTFPARTEGSVKKHWYKDMHYAEFAEDESAALAAAIKEYEASKWKVIGQKVGKPAKACEQYAKEHFGKQT